MAAPQQLVIAYNTPARANARATPHPQRARDHRNDSRHQRQASPYRTRARPDANPAYYPTEPPTATNPDAPPKRNDRGTSTADHAHQDTPAQESADTRTTN